VLDAALQQQQQSMANRQNGGAAHRGTVPVRNESHYIGRVGVLLWCY